MDTSLDVGTAPVFGGRRFRPTDIVAILIVAAALLMLLHALVAHRTLTPQQMAHELDEAVTLDSRGWFANRFDHGSMTGFKVVDHPSSREYLVTADYTFNDGSPGWVAARILDGRVHCLQYWDRTFCRIVDGSTQGPVPERAGRADDTESTDTTLLDCALNHGLTGEVCKDAGIGVQAKPENPSEQSGTDTPSEPPAGGGSED